VRSAPDSAGRAYSAPPESLAGLREFMNVEEVWKSRKEIKGKGEGAEGRGGKRKGIEEGMLFQLQLLDPPACLLTVTRL